MPMDSYIGIGRVTVVAGLEDALAVLRTAVLLARNFRATLHLVVFEAERFQIHFGSAPCHALLLGLLNSVENRLSQLVSGASANFAVEIGILSKPYSISIHIHAAGSARMENGN